MVSVVRGANSPLLIKTITEQLAYEHKVLEGSVERKEVGKFLELVFIRDISNECVVCVICLSHRSSVCFLVWFVVFDPCCAGVSVTLSTLQDHCIHSFIPSTWFCPLPRISIIIKSSPGLFLYIFIEPSHLRPFLSVFFVFLLSCLPACILSTSPGLHITSDFSPKLPLSCFALQLLSFVEFLI